MNLLVTGAFNCNEKELNSFRALGHEVVFMQQERDTLPCEYVWVEGIIGNGIFIHHPIEKFTSLKYIQLTSAGFDRVPMEYVKEHSIRIYNARGVYSIPMAEFALSGVLELYKQKRFFYEKQKVHLWEKHRGVQELYGKRVCIVGCGSVGTECAKRFKAFGCQVAGVDVMPYQSDWYEQMVTLDALDELLPSCDVLLLTLPLTNETRGLVNSKRLSRLKDGAVLVNIARGAVVDQEALTTELRKNRISAVLDVFDSEPLPVDSPLWEMENVIITPHNSFVGDGNQKRMLEIAYENLRCMNYEK